MHKLSGNPRGITGRKILKTMDENHLHVFSFAKQFFDIKSDYKILDIGCGDGSNIKRYLEQTKSKVVGIDISKLSCKFSKKTNKQEIENQRCEIFNTSIEDFKYENDYFDLVTTFCSLQFWSNKSLAFKNIYKVLKTGGKFIIADHGNYIIEEVADNLKKIGFIEVKINKLDPNLVCIAAIK